MELNSGVVFVDDVFDDGDVLLNDDRIVYGNDVQKLFQFKSFSNSTWLNTPQQQDI